MNILARIILMVFGGIAVTASNIAAQTPTTKPEQQAEALTGVMTTEHIEQQLTQALEALQSEDPAVWQQAEKRAQKWFARAASPSATLLQERAQQALMLQQIDQAMTHLTDLVTLEPNFAEGWRLRAEMHLQQQQLGAALSDLSAALAAEPRHFFSWMMLAAALEQLEDPKRAVFAYKKALAIHPHLEIAQKAVKRLEYETAGSDA